TEFSISELEKRFFFQNGLREETARKIKEESPSTLQDAIEIASNFEFAHYSGKPPRAPAKGSQGPSSSGHRAPNSKQHNTKRSDNKKGKSEDWKKTAMCRNCGKVGHISPDCTQSKRTEANRYMQGAVYAILEADARAFKTKDRERPVTIFIENGNSLNGVTEELVKKLELDVTEGDMMQVDLGYDQVEHHPRRTVEMSLQLPGFPLTAGTFQNMPIPEGKDIVLGMMWLREQNPDIDRSTGQIAPRINVENTQTSREIFNYYRQHGHHGQFGRTKIISSKQFQQMLSRDKDIETVFVFNPHDSEKAERFKSQGRDALEDNPAYETLLKYADTVFLKQWRQSPDQRKTIQEWAKEMVQAGIIRPSSSAFCAPTFCGNKPVGLRIVQDYRLLNLATILPAIPMPRKEDTFDAMAGSYWYSCIDLLWG
ncbi:hypothetical protein F442_23119, partial [Phytophthora nicotianae P10297]